MSLLLFTVSHHLFSYVNRWLSCLTLLFHFQFIFILFLFFRASTCFVDTVFLKSLSIRFLHEILLRFSSAFLMSCFCNRINSSACLFWSFYVTLHTFFKYLLILDQVAIWANVISFPSPHPSLCTAYSFIKWKKWVFLGVSSTRGEFVGLQTLF